MGGVWIVVTVVGDAWANSTEGRLVVVVDAIVAVAGAGAYSRGGRLVVVVTGTDTATGSGAGSVVVTERTGCCAGSVAGGTCVGTG